MQYYHDIITEKSFKFLQELQKEFNFVLIGGWAVYLYSHSLKSKDIDIIVDYSELGKLKEKYEVFKNSRLKKYEIKTGEFDVDIYLPHYSQLGMDLTGATGSAIVKEGFRVPRLETLFLLKLFAWRERQGSAKGEKDKLDIFSLAFLPEFNWKDYLDLANKGEFAGLRGQFAALLEKTIDIKELGINLQAMSKFKKATSAKLKS